MNPSSRPPWLDPGLAAEDRVDPLIEAMTAAEKIAQLWHATPAIPHLSVPAYDWWNECLHGVARAGRATVFPQAIGLAAAFDEDLVHSVGAAIAREARAKHHVAANVGNRGPSVGLTFWSPNVNIYRDPRWGRGQETWGEDPFLTARLGTAFVRGLQGDDPERLQAAACAKHFLAHSGPESGRASFDARVSKRDLRETYLPAFRALIQEGNVAGVMCAYNAVNGSACCGSREILGDLLRTELGFRGYVVTDCWAGEMLHSHHRETGTLEEAVVQALKAGVNLFCGSARDALAKALADGLLDEAVLDDALRPSLLVRIRLGLFDPPTSVDATLREAEVLGCEDHVERAREAAVRSFVLLQNERDVLPLASDLRSVYVTGPNAASVEALLGTYHGVNENLVTVLEGVTARVGAGTTLTYAKGCALDQASASPTGWACHYAKGADVTIAVMGLSGELVGEDGDAFLSPHGGDWPSLRLPPGQVEYLRALREGHSQPIVLVVLSGVPLILDEIREYVDAILLAWCPGQAGGHALADVLFGDTSPSGRMPVTVPRRVEDLPAFTDYAMRDRTYRFAHAEALHPFGFGLSYTTFAYGDLTIEPEAVGEDDTVEVSVEIENTGRVAGREIAQLYLRDPRDDPEKPRCFLHGIQSIRLAPGESRRVCFALPPEARQVVGGEGEVLRPHGSWGVTVSGCSPTAGTKWTSFWWTGV